MELTDLEREFSRKLLGESWVSPPIFDHKIVARLVELVLRKPNRFHPVLSNTGSLTRAERRPPRKRSSAAALHKAAQVPRCTLLSRIDRCAEADFGRFAAIG